MDCSAEESAAAHRGDDHIQVGNVLQQFQRSRALAGDDALIIVGMDNVRAGLEPDPFERAFPGFECRLTKRDLSTVAGDRVFLHRRGIVWHDDIGRDAAHFRSQSQRLGMVPGGMRADSAGRLFVAERKYRIGGAAELEGAHLLHVFTFEKNLGTHFLIQTCIG